ncbi:MAG: hypothetical protein JSU64_05900 [candidate division WOR-3 bacterium]|nr:MAG: hypothetical protein JSU64_05900 [candidate division WOR-3 bacterium]
MKKLFAIAVAASLFSGLYAASIGLGVQYTISEPAGYMADDTLNFSYPSIVLDVMVPIIPVLAARMGIVEYNIISEDDGGASYAFGTGVYGDICFMIPMQMPLKPYIPIGFTYGGAEGAGSEMHLKGGVGGMMDFGGASGYLEGGVKHVTWSPEEGDSDNGLYFYVQGGVRVHIPSM